MKITLLAATFALALAAAPALAGEGNGDPFPNNVGNLATTVTTPRAQVADLGAAPQANPAGNSAVTVPSIETSAAPMRTAAVTRTQPARRHVLTQANRHAAHHSAAPIAQSNS